jgi:hypothetical protein
LALQNKAIRSGVPIGPFQTKRKRKSLRHSLDSTGVNQTGGRARKQGRVASVTPTSGMTMAPAVAAATKKGDLEVRKDLTIESQRAEIFFPTESSSSRPSTSSVVARAKVSYTHNSQCWDSAVLGNR